jgi:multidrug transporter EmrE-like cation transporter
MEITIGNEVVGQVMSANSGTFTGLLPLLIIMISIPIAFYVLRKVILLFPRK